MLITYLGHAGFCVETSQSIIIMDPWLSAFGAFDSAWFQFPCNHGLASLVQEKLQDSSKDRYVYISHEHKDHFDLEFLNSLEVRDFKLIIPIFRRATLRHTLENYRCQEIMLCHHREKISLRDGYVQLYVDDSGLNHDSAILFYSDRQCFFNLNDAKLHDSLSTIKEEQGSIDVFTCQFSGATWHPTCYEYPEDVYQEISRTKMISKFEATAQAIEIINPKMYLPSAGPPCFLDPMLFHLNFEAVNIFPRARTLLTYLEERLYESKQLNIPEILPGDVIDVIKSDFAYKVGERSYEDNFSEYMKSYSDQYKHFFREKQRAYSVWEIDHILDSLRQLLEYKLSFFEKEMIPDRSIYIQIHEAPDRMLCVDFQNQHVKELSQLPESNFYLLTVPAWQIAPLLDGKLTWEDFALTFRMRLKRDPDIYETLIQGFFIVEPQDLHHFFESLKKIELNREQITVKAGGLCYAVDKLCPHQGGELSEGWVEENRYLVCPRHRWRFDLQNHGRCETSRDSIHACALEED